MENQFLPVSKKDLQERGISQLDFVYVSGDAYVDHPSFAPALLCRLLEAHGYSVGIIAQPNWKDPESVKALGTPKYAFLVSSGNMDSMVNHYTVAKKHRRTDAYSPGGHMGLRPDRAVIVYSNLLRHVFPDVPIIIGGLEASLRRLGHYDYWSDSVKRSILLDSGADLLSYGMGEHSLVEIADSFASGLRIQDLSFIRGTVYKTRHEEDIYEGVRLPDFETVKADKAAYTESFRIQYENTDPFQAKVIYEVYGGRTCVVQNPPSLPLTTQEFDDLYELPFTYRWHPMYEAQGGIPALQEVKFSITSNRGCFGGCNFCSLNFHQGRILQARSHASIIKEAKRMTKDPDFKGYIHDVGGPTAQFREPACDKQMTKGACKNRQCLFPDVCPHMKVSHQDYLDLLRELRSLPGVKKVFIRSGIRFDYLLKDKNTTFLDELCRYHISGQLRVAPEHISDRVLKLMGKPKQEVYEQFTKEFDEINARSGKQQYLVPYLMSSHPGSTLEDAVELALYLKKHHLRPDQVQDFYPTPGTVSTCIYYTGIHPLTGEKVYVAKNPHEKALQRALVQYWMPDHYHLVREALHKASRDDLVGYGPECLVPPRPWKKDKEDGKGGHPRNHSNSRKGMAQQGRNPEKHKEATSKKGKQSKGSTPMWGGQAGHAKFSKGSRQHKR